MIGYLKGIILEKLPTEIIIDVHGVGYVLAVSLNTSEVMADIGGEAALFVHTHVREDAIQLFGFATSEERAAFRMLISVSGIGPKIALGILSAMSVGDLREHIVRNNLVALSGIPGIGKKTAERLVIELREKMQKLDVEAEVTTHNGQQNVRSEAMLALTSLGYSRPAAEAAIRNALKESNTEQLTVEQLIKASLRHANT
ncbi:MAG TPA: Holliday junction branch migration protein RuvA [Candidatus Kapabacteria bacterium]|nr:Holliday junction branch migration protein RuvA [Candidatus Kapabacteria bacterium]